MNTENTAMTQEQEELLRIQNNAACLDNFKTLTGFPGHFKDLAQTLLALGVDKEEVTRAVYYMLVKQIETNNTQKVTTSTFCLFRDLQEFVKPRFLQPAQ